LLQMAHAAPVLEVVLNDASTSISEYRHYDRYYQSTRTAS
jgi:hypothetical protein